MNRWFHLHNHSKYSSLDGMSEVETLVAKAVEYNQPAIALTDHGNMAGVFRLYREAKANDLRPFPGVEAYLVQDHQQKDAKRYHLGLLALDYEGYVALVKLVAKSHTRPHFHIKPRIDLADLASLAEEGVTEHLAITTGCYFSWPIQLLVTKGFRAALQAVRT